MKLKTTLSAIELDTPFTENDGYIYTMNSEVLYFRSPKNKVFHIIQTVTDYELCQDRTSYSCNIFA